LDKPTHSLFGSRGKPGIMSACGSKVLSDRPAISDGRIFYKKIDDIGKVLAKRFTGQKDLQQA